MTLVFGAMAKSEARLLTREPSIIVWAIGIPLVADLVLACIPAMRKPVDAFDGLSWSQVYLPTLTLFTLSLLAVQMMPTVLSTYRQTGVLRRLRTTPVAPAQLLIAVCSVLSAVGLITAILLVGIPFAAGLGLPRNLVSFVLVTLLAMVSFLSVGALITAVARPHASPWDSVRPWRPSSGSRRGSGCRSQ